MTARSGPLLDLKVVEVAGIGPAPFAAMCLADLGADVVRIDRPGGHAPAGVPVDHRKDVLNRGRRSIALDLKTAKGVATALKLIERADALIEGFRPGVMEGLDLGPEVCLARNPKLVYGRMTGWGQDGPRAKSAGHDLTYLALTGALHAMGDPDRPPTPPLNLVGDFGGGGLEVAFGVVSAVLHARATGEGQVVDAAIVDGVSQQSTLFYGLKAMGLWNDARGANLLDGAAPFYRCYACTDGFVAVGAIEPQFYAALLDGLGLDADDWPQWETERWSEQAKSLAIIFAEKSRAQWEATFQNTDACVAPVLTFDEAAAHPHAAARRAHVAVDGVNQPAPAPRFSKTPGAISRPPPEPGQHADDILRDWGVD